MLESHRFSVVVRSDRNGLYTRNYVEKALAMYVGHSMPFDSVSVTAQPQKSEERAKNVTQQTNAADGPAAHA